MNEFFEISENEKKIIFSLYNKSPQDVLDDVEILKEWLKKQPHIPEIKDKKILELLLLRNKFRMEKTKLKIDKYFTVKSLHVNMFDEMDPNREGFQNVSKYCKTIPMPKLTPNHERVVYIHLKTTGDLMELYSFRNWMLVTCVIAEARMINDYAAGEVLITNLDCLSLAHIRQMDLAFISKFLQIYLEGFSGRISSIHYINAPPTVAILLNLMNKVLPKRLQDRVLVHNDLNTLYRYVPKECLPVEIGGTGPSTNIIHDKIWNLINNDRENIITRNSLKTDESLRIGEPPIKSELFGLDGTFKKINID